MFDINNIQYNQASGQYTCCCQCNSPQDAEFLVASYTHISKIFSMSGEMFQRGSVAYIGAGTREDVCRIAECINRQIR